MKYDEQGAMCLVDYFGRLCSSGNIDVQARCNEDDCYKYRRYSQEGYFCPEFKTLSLRFRAFEKKTILNLAGPWPYDPRFEKKTLET